MAGPEALSIEKLFRVDGDVALITAPMGILANAQDQAAGYSAAAPEIWRATSGRLTHIKAVICSDDKRSGKLILLVAALRDGVKLWVRVTIIRGDGG